MHIERAVNFVNERGLATLKRWQIFGRIIFFFSFREIINYIETSQTAMQVHYNTLYMCIIIVLRIIRRNRVHSSDKNQMGRRNDAMLFRKILHDSYQWCITYIHAVRNAQSVVIMYNSFRKHAFILNKNFTMQVYFLQTRRDIVKYIVIISTMLHAIQQICTTFC
jgi:hypothetical protein